MFSSFRDEWLFSTQVTPEIEGKKEGKKKKRILNSAELTIFVHFTVSCFSDMFTLQMLQLMAMTTLNGKVYN